MKRKFIIIALRNCELAFDKLFKLNFDCAFFASIRLLQDIELVVLRMLMLCQTLLHLRKWRDALASTRKTFSTTFLAWAAFFRASTNIRIWRSFPGEMHLLEEHPKNVDHSLLVSMHKRRRLLITPPMSMIWWGIIKAIAFKVKSNWRFLLKVAISFQPKQHIFEHWRV